MSDRASVVPRRLLAVLGAFVLLAVASVSAAQADPYGELQNFGEGEITTPEKAMGVDPETGNVYIVDRNEHSFKILDFSSTGEKLASTQFTPKVVTGQQDLVEGVAVDPSMHRLYVLALVTRREEPDQEVTAASALYAFSTVANGKKELEPAEGTEPSGTDKAILVNQDKFQPTSKTFGVSLLEPSGIAVDPTTHDVIIAGTIDRGKLSKVVEEVEENVKETTVAVQRITSGGALGARYVDSRTEDLETCAEAFCVNSPVVSSAGKVYVASDGVDELEEFPVPTSSKVPPENVPVTPNYVAKFNIGCELECWLGGKLVPEFLEQLVEIPEEGAGSSLTISPEDGTIWARARVKYQLPGSGQGSFYGGAMEFSPTFDEQGWGGGQSLASAAGKCVIDDLTEVPAFAAGKSGTLFVLDRSPGGGEEPKGPRIIKFGPNGSGCPHGTATLSAEVGGVEVTEGESVPISDSVTLSSKLTQANALSVEWEFGDGTMHTVSTREQQLVKIQHVFTKTGTLTIKEKIHTDNLATPVIEKQEKIDIVGAPKVVTGEATQIASTSATLTGTVNPNGQAVTECKFEYGETTAYASGSVPCTPSPGSGEEPKEVTAKVSGLAKLKLYHFRLVAINKSGEEKGSDHTFTTETKPVATTEAASSVGETSATLHAMVNPEGVSTQCEFEYGTTKSYGSHASCASAPGSGEGLVPVSAPVTGLGGGVTYHFRIVAKSSGGTSYGEDKTFTTSRQKIEEEEAKRREEEAAAQRRQEEEAAAAAAKKHQEEEAAAAAAKKHQEEEAAAAAAKKHQEEEAKAKKPPTRAQLLAKALKACKKGPKKKRAKCEATARKKYGPKAKGKKK